jgi:hypothetical protein
MTGAGAHAAGVDESTAQNSIDRCRLCKGSRRDTSGMRAGLYESKDGRRWCVHHEVSAKLFGE